MRQTLLLGAYEPDKAENLSDALTIVENVWPVANGYRPVKAFSAMTAAFPEGFNGGAAYVASDTTSTLIGGSATDLYKYASGAWSSMLGSLTTTGRWHFAQFGDHAIAVAGDDPVDIDLQAGTAAALAGSPPTASFVWVVRDQVCLGRANGELNLVQWSGFNDHEDWTPGVNQAGFQPMLTGGAVMGGTGGEYGLVFQRGRVVRQSYVGADAGVFQWDEISANIGCIASESIVQAGNLVFFLSDRGFMVCDGTGVRPIGDQRVDTTFLGRWSPLDYGLMYSAVDPARYLVLWSMPGAIFAYNWALDRWTTVSMEITGIFPGFTANVSLEELDVLYPSGLDSIPYSLDDPRWAGGEPSLFVVSGENEIGTLGGNNMAAKFRTGFRELVPGRYSRLRWIRPITDAISGMTVRMDTKARLGDTEVLSSFGTLRTSGDMPVRASGRHIAFEFEIAADTVWSYVQGFSLDYEPGGGR